MDRGVPIPIRILSRLNNALHGKAGAWVRLSVKFILNKKILTLCNTSAIFLKVKRVSLKRAIRCFAISFRIEKAGYHAGFA